MEKIINYPFVLMRRLYDWTAGWAHKKSSDYALFLIAIAESSFFPIPPDVLMVPLVITNPKSWWKKALICTAGSVCGAFLGYAIGYLFFETVGVRIVNFYNMQEAVQIVAQQYSDNAFIAVLLGAFTPIPYKAITITAGMFKISLAAFFVASVIGRGARFFMVAGTIRLFGEKIKNTIEKYFNTLSIIFLVLLIVGFIALKYLHLLQ
ncbi:MAG: DedA family protein [Endomicrobia bacterium]|nr:DedA family protein [Endomicrobiia bacterium]MCL2506108.1 DedA family protein [Endomicrobiia bacterium]